MPADEIFETSLRSFISSYSQEEYQEFAKCILDELLVSIDHVEEIVAYSSARAKDPKSLEAKCRKKIKDENGHLAHKYSVFEEQITDLAGVRIVTYLLRDLPIIRDAIFSKFDVLREHSENKLTLLGSNKIGYLSEHFVVRPKADAICEGTDSRSGTVCEIQVRTVLQDAWAQVFHDRHYKRLAQDVEVTEMLARQTNLLSGALELLDHQIEALVEEYDARASFSNLLKQPLCRDDFLIYFKQRLNIKTSFFDWKHIKEVMEKEGLENIGDFDDLLIKSDCFEKLIEYPRLLTGDKIVYYTLIVAKREGFFETNKGDFIISRDSHDFLDDFIDVDSLCDRFNVPIE